MRVTEVRNRVVERLGEAAASGDEDVAAQALNFCRALLITLASEDADSDVNVQTLAIKTGTAGRILGLNQEYVRELIRRRVLGANKSNGEFHVPLSAMVSFQAKSVKFSTSPVPLDTSKWLEPKVGTSAGWPKGHGSHHKGHDEQQGLA